MYYIHIKLYIYKQIYIYIYIYIVHRSEYWYGDCNVVFCYISEGFKCLYKNNITNNDMNS